jgi:hypothetical protein
MKLVTVEAVCNQGARLERGFEARFRPRGPFLYQSRWREARAISADVRELFGFEAVGGRKCKAEVRCVTE